MSKLGWNYDEIKKGASEEGFVNLTTGPQIVKILNVEDVAEKTYLKIHFDINEGALKNYFKDMYTRDTREDKHWPNQATLYRSYSDAAKYFFAGFITAVEKSNDGFKFNPDGDWKKQLEGKLLVVNFGYQEYISDDTDDNGKLIVKQTIKPIETRSIQALKDGKIKELELTTLKDGDFTYKGVGIDDITRTPNQAQDLPKDKDLPF